MLSSAFCSAASQNPVLPRGAFDLLHRLQTGFFDQLVVGAHVQGAKVAVVDAGLPRRGYRQNAAADRW